MRPIRFLTTHPFVVFAVLLGLGLLIATVAYRNQVVPRPPVDAKYRTDLINDRQKAILSEEQDTSRWLLALTSGALTATLATRISGARTDDQDSLAMMVAYASLIVSMYGAFLSHQAKLSILRDGPLNLVYTDLLKVPSEIQAWAFIVGIVALGTAVFLRPKDIVTAVLLFLAFAMGADSQAQGVDFTPCVKAWYEQRLHLQEPNTKDSVRFLTSLQQKAHSPAAKFNTCGDVNAMLDSVRARATLQQQHPATASEVATYMKTIQPELDGVGGSVGEAVAALLALLTFDRPHGELIFTKPEGATNEISFRVTIDMTVLQGLTTPYQLRVTADSHSIRVQPPTRFSILWQDKTFSVANGETKMITVPVQP